MSDIADRFKRYELVSQPYLSIKTPVIIRLDGNSFTHVARQWGKSYSEGFANTLAESTKEMMPKIQGSRFAYLQSDEVSILLIDYENMESQPWFDYNLSKLISISTGMLTAFFNHNQLQGFKPAWFDARAFNLPQHEVVNYFIWRQKDAIRNSMSMFAREHFSHNQLYQKDFGEMDIMLHDKGFSWDNLPLQRTRGTAIYKKDGEWFIDTEIPSFTEDRDFVDVWVEEK